MEILKTHNKSIHGNVTYSCDHCKLKQLAGDNWKDTSNLSMKMSHTHVINMYINVYKMEGTIKETL